MHIPFCAEICFQFLQKKTVYSELIFVQKCAHTVLRNKTDRNFEQKFCITQYASSFCPFTAKFETVVSFYSGKYNSK